MLHTLAQNWWALALRGLVAVLFGLLTFFLPGNHAGDARATRRSLRLSGWRFNVIVFFRLMSHHWALLIEGAIGIIAGILTFGWPAITALVLLYVIAFWAIFTGIFEIVAGIRLRKQSPTNGCYLQWASSLCCLASRSSLRPVWEHWPLSCGSVRTRSYSVLFFWHSHSGFEAPPTSPAS